MSIAAELYSITLCIETLKRGSREKTGKVMPLLKKRM